MIVTYYYLDSCFEAKKGVSKMTDYQHPAEQGSTGEDFLEPRPTYPLYQYSVFLNGGRDEQLVVRASTFDELLAGKRNINRVLDKVNSQNQNHKTNGASNGNTYTNGQNGTSGANNGNAHSNGQSVCQHHETKVFTVKKEGANQGRNFKSCTQCREFLGFV
jgi:hypothetical protein